VFDLIITDYNGEHRWSDGKDLTPELTLLELQPGQSKTIEMNWVVQPLTSSLSVNAVLIPYSTDSLGPVTARAPVYVSMCPGY